MSEVDDVWVPEACTLPMVDQPLRLSEFDDLFATSLRGLSRVSPTLLRWLVDPTAEETVRDLTARETECCSFFTFTLSSDADQLRLRITVPPAQTAVLDGLL